MPLSPQYTVDAESGGSRRPMPSRPGGLYLRSRPHLWSWNLDRFSRRWRWSRSGLWYRRVWDRFRDIKWLRARLMCADNAGSPACATRWDCLSSKLLYLDNRCCISSKMLFDDRAGISCHVPNNRRRRRLTRMDSPYAYATSSWSAAKNLSSSPNWAHGSRTHGAASNPVRRCRLRSPSISSLNCSPRKRQYPSYSE